MIAWSMRRESVGLYLKELYREFLVFLCDFRDPVLVGLFQYSVDVGSGDGEGCGSFVLATFLFYSLSERFEEDGGNVDGPWSWWWDINRCGLGGSCCVCRSTSWGNEVDGILLPVDGRVELP